MHTLWRAARDGMYDANEFDKSMFATHPQQHKEIHARTNYKLPNKQL